MVEAWFIWNEVGKWLVIVAALVFSIWAWRAAKLVRTETRSAMVKADRHRRESIEILTEVNEKFQTALETILERDPHAATESLQMVGETLVRLEEGMAILPDVLFRKVKGREGGLKRKRNFDEQLVWDELEAASGEILLDSMPSAGPLDLLKKKFAEIGMAHPTMGNVIREYMEANFTQAAQLAQEAPQVPQVAASTHPMDR